MNISLIAAISLDQVIGNEKFIPWSLPRDLLWFKSNTINKPVIMGRITHESIGKRLPNRKNIILSNNYYDNNNKEGIIWTNSVDKALLAASTGKGKVEEVMVIGGGKIYELFLPLANRIYFTHVNAKVFGDTYFPSYKINEWHSVFFEFYTADEIHSYDYYFEILERSC